MPRVSSPQNPRFKETARLVESSRERPVELRIVNIAAIARYECNHAAGGGPKRRAPRTKIDVFDDRRKKMRALPGAKHLRRPRECAVL